MKFTMCKGAALNVVFLEGYVQGDTIERNAAREREQATYDSQLEVHLMVYVDAWNKWTEFR